MELQGFYGHDTDSLSGADGVKPSPFLLHPAASKPTTPTLKFHNHFPPDVATWVVKSNNFFFYVGWMPSYTFFLEPIWSKTQQQLSIVDPLFS